MKHGEPDQCQVYQAKAPHSNFMGSSKASEV